jgi:putative hemolysin
MVVFVAAVTASLLFAFFCSISEAVVLTVSHAQIEALGKSTAGNILRRFKREIDLPIAAILTLNTAAATVGASVSGAYYEDVFHDPSKLWVFSAVFTLALLIFSEIVPKTLGVVSAGTLAAPVAFGVAGLVFILRPLLTITRAIARAIAPTHSRPITSLEEIRLLTALGRTEGAVGAIAADMIEGVAALRELRARDVMVPRARVVYLSGQRSVDENLDVVHRSGHSRFLYSATGDLDQIEGVILVKDLMFTLRENPDNVDVAALATKALVVPASTTLERLLRMFQRERRHLAIVVDEYGGTEGIVTLEDVLEEIVGEIEDESDRVDPFMTRRADGSVICRGWAEARAVLGSFGVEGDDVQAVTVGGLVAELVGRVPRVGDQIEWRNLKFLVTQASARRAERVEIRPLPKPEAQA